MSKTSSIWHFDKTPLKRNYFFFPQHSHNCKSKLYNYHLAHSTALVSFFEPVGTGRADRSPSSACSHLQGPTTAQTFHTPKNASSAPRNGGGIIQQLTSDLRHFSLMKTSQKLSIYVNSTT